LVTRETASGAVHGAQELSIHGQMIRLIFTSLCGKEAESANDLATPEHYVNLQPMFSCGLMADALAMRSQLATRIDKNGAHTFACGAGFQALNGCAAPHWR
jgi:hypothetical protein